MKNGNLVTTIEIKDRQGRVIDTKEVVTYAGLLNRAHQEGLKKVYTELIQAPSETNEMTAISLAEVVTEKGVFRDYGDANAESVDARIIPHIIRMAVTRAKARALRDAVNIGVVAIEELGEEYPDHGEMKNQGQSKNDGSQKNRASESPKTSQDLRRQTQKPEQRLAGRDNSQSSDETMSEAQRRYLFRILAEHGVNGEAAHNYLKQTFGVDTLKAVSKADASEMIDLLLSKPDEMLEGVAA
jgi:hypothetical protein